MVRSREKTYLFSTIELVLSISILAIGITAIIGLFPAGLNETNYSVGENYSGISVNDMYAYIARESHFHNWETFLSSIPDSKPDTAKTKNVIMDTNNWGSPVEGNIYEPSNAAKGIYGIKVGSGNLSEFSAQVLIWRSAVNKNQKSGETNFNDWPENPNNIAGINIETSWPLAKEYKNRSINKYYFEVFNQNPDDSSYSNGNKHKQWWWDKMQDKWAHWYNKWNIKAGKKYKYEKEKKEYEEKKHKYEKEKKEYEEKKHKYDKETEEYKKKNKKEYEQEKEKHEKEKKEYEQEKEKHEKHKKEYEKDY
ncbi:MAG: hypothetical protein GY756_19875 [bacterium]|nr:hypothetical protein [bacterium]